MQDHDQSVDPNLVKLADAFDIASAKLKEACEGAEGASSPALPSVAPGRPVKRASAPHWPNWLHNAMLSGTAEMALHHMSGVDHVAQLFGSLIWSDSMERLGGVWLWWRIGLNTTWYTAGTEAGGGRVKGKKVRDIDPDGGSAQEVPILHARQVAGSSLPGLYKSRHLPHIDPNTLSAYESDSDGGGTATASPKKQQKPEARKGPADIPHATGKQAATVPEQEPVLQQLSKSPSLKPLKDPPLASIKGSSIKRTSRKPLPGRLRKKLAKESAHATQGLTVSGLPKV